MQQKILNHLQQMVSFYPTSENQSAVKELLEYCRHVLERSGALPDVKIHCINEKYSLTGSTQGTKHPKVLLQAHVDVVPAPGVMQKLQREGDALYGRGVYDMLFAAACYLALLEEQADRLVDYDIGVMLTGDEELGGFAGVGALVEMGYGCNVCILPDGGRGFGDLDVAAKGVFNFDLVANGRAHHGARPWEGDGAANKLVLLLNDILQLFDSSSRENSTLTITSLNGGDAINKGPSTARAHLDIRYRDQEDYKRLKQDISRLAEQYGASLENVDFVEDYHMEVDNPYVRAFLEVYKEHLDGEVTFGKSHGSSDARFFSNKEMPVLMFRPDGKGAHSDNESLSLASMMRFYGLLEDFVLKTAKIK